MDDKDYALLKQRLKTLADFNLDYYKSKQMRRRLDAFISAQAPTVPLYCKRLERDRDALAKLKNFLTINVSEFFRDPEQFALLRTRILPDLLKRSPRLKIWSAGCSHGAEAYSVVMMLEELSPSQRHRVLATDVDERILARAKRGGPYTESELGNLDRKHLLKYFDRAGAARTVAGSVTQRVEFRRHNLLQDPFEEGFDLIICRNVVIYFADAAKRRLNEGFTRSLKDGGVLFIGATEAMLDAGEVGLERLYPAFYLKPQSKSVPRPERPIRGGAPPSKRVGLGV